MHERHQNFFYIFDVISNIQKRARDNKIKDSTASIILMRNKGTKNNFKEITMELKELFFYKFFKKKKPPENFNRSSQMWKQLAIKMIVLRMNLSHTKCSSSAMNEKPSSNCRI